MKAAARDAGAVEEHTAARKTEKYVELESRYLFQHIAVETLGPINCSAANFLSGLLIDESQKLQVQFVKAAVERVDSALQRCSAS